MSSTHELLTLDSTNHLTESSSEVSLETLTSTMTFEMSTINVIQSSVTATRLTESEEEIFQGVHTLLTIVALATNCLSLLVIYGFLSQLTTPLRLLTSLAFAQMLAPWAIMTIYFSRSICQDEIHTSVLLSSHNSASLTLLLLVISHHQASFRPFQYARVMSAGRIWSGVFLVWTSAIIAGHIHFLVSLKGDLPGSIDGYCERVARNTGYALAISATLCLVVLSVGGLVYQRIFVSIRPVETLIVHGQSAVGRTKGVVTRIAILVGYGLAWIPYLSVKWVIAYRKMDSRDTQLAIGVCQAAIVVNCALDPLIYGLRMDSVTDGYARLGKRTWTRMSELWNWCRRRFLCGDEDVAPTTPLNQIDSICN